VFSAAPGQPKRDKETSRYHKGQEGNIMTRVFSISRGVTQWVYGGRLFIVSARAVQESADGSPSGRSSQRVEDTTDSVCRRDGSIHVESFNRIMKAWGVLKSKWDPIRKKLVRRLLEEQDKVLRSYFAQKGSARSKGGERGNCKGREHVQ
jgi:hypothetical protein